MLTEVDLASALGRDYGISASSIEPHVGGWEADCFVVDEAWFVKKWRGAPPINLALLEHLAEKGLPVAPPVRTTDGRLSATTYAVFPYVRGARAPEDPALLGHVLRQVHAIADVDLPLVEMDDDWCIEFLRGHPDHPWITDRRDELAAAVDRLVAVTDSARSRDLPYVLVHHDLYGDNLLVDDSCDVVAIVDWDHACLAPREHDLWMLADEQRSTGLLDAYGVSDLDLVHLEYAMLARALRDLAVRLQGDVDRPGVEEWGFRRLARVDGVLDEIRFSSGP